MLVKSKTLQHWYANLNIMLYLCKWNWFHIYLKCTRNLVYLNEITETGDFMFSKRDWLILSLLSFGQRRVRLPIKQYNTSLFIEHYTILYYQWFIQSNVEFLEASPNIKFISRGNQRNTPEKWEEAPKCDCARAWINISTVYRIDTKSETDVVERSDGPLDEKFRRFARLFTSFRIFQILTLSDNRD